MKTGAAWCEAIRRNPSAGTLSAAAKQADELRFRNPAEALELSMAAARTVWLVPTSGRVRAEVMAVHGSVLRSRGMLDDANKALLVAAKQARDPETRAEVARRLAILRATQGRREDTKKLVEVSLRWAKLRGGRVYGEYLAGASAAFIIIHDFRRAKSAASRALRFLPPNGDKCHLASLYNLSRCCLELSTCQEELAKAAKEIKRAESVAGNDYTATKMVWLRALLHRRSEEPAKALKLLQSARPSVEASQKPIDLAILLLDIAEIFIDLGRVEEASESILQSFPLLRPLKDRPEAFKALLTIQRSASLGEVDVELLKAARKELEKTF